MKKKKNLKKEKYPQTINLLFNYQNDHNHLESFIEKPIFDIILLETSVFLAVFKKTS